MHRCEACQRLKPSVDAGAPPTSLPVLTECYESTSMFRLPKYCMAARLLWSFGWAGLD